MRPTLPLFVIPLFTISACAPSIVSTPPAACAGLIPTDWSQPIPGEPIPAESSEKAWAQAFVGQTGQLAKANGRTADAISIFRNCEDMINKARPR